VALTLTSEGGKGGQGGQQDGLGSDQLAPAHSAGQTALEVGFHTEALGAGKMAPDVGAETLYARPATRSGGGLLDPPTSLAEAICRLLGEVTQGLGCHAEDGGGLDGRHGLHLDDPQGAAGELGQRSQGLHRHRFDATQVDLVRSGGRMDSSTRLRSTKRGQAHAGQKRRAKGAAFRLPGRS
jgi:hypothetical protein